MDAAKAMPRFETAMTFPRPIDDVFDFFRRPANLLRVNPPDFHLSLLEAPEVLQQGSRVVVQVRRFGIPQRLESEITALEPNALFVDELRQGPFRKWVQTHRFAATPEGTQVTFQIDFEPPSGMLGLMVTAAAIEKELKAVFAYRAGKLHELLGPSPNGNL
jgi:ligand-binding SRPBCC domain-containing protein